MNGLVSVILPVYNVEKYIREALDSVINQTYKNLEIILVDDGSPDSSGDICDEYAAKDDRIRVIHKENGGVSSARNAGIEAARGDWIYFMDPDDWIDPDTIEAAVGMAAENGCDMCLFDFENVYKGKGIHRHSFIHEGTVFKDLSDETVFCAYACSSGSACCCITRSSAVKAIRFNETLINREDEIFMWQLYKMLDSICCIKKIMYHYRCVSSSASNMPVPDISTDKNLKIYRIELEIARDPDYPPNAVTAARSKYIELFFSVCTEIFSEDKPLKERIAKYHGYTTGREFTEAIHDCTDLYFSKAAKILLKRKKAPFWFWVYILVKLRGLRNSLRNTKKF